MRLLLGYPPKAYVYMPYLATALLKGYIESVSHHSVAQWDINLDYHRFLWSPDFARQAARELEKQPESPRTLYFHVLAGYLEQQVTESYEAVRENDTYRSWGDVDFHNRVLTAAVDLADYLDESAGIRVFRLPRAWGQVEELIDRLEHTVMGRWVRPLLDRCGDCDVLGLSVAYAEQFLTALLIARIVTERFPHVRIVLGGNVATHYKREILQDEPLRRLLDYAVFYEGEQPLLDLLSFLEQGGAGALPSNIVRFRPDGAEYAEDLHGKPKLEAVPDFRGLPLEHYPTPKPILPILTSKGCYWGKCTYCSHYEGYGQGYYSFKEEHVIQTIRSLQARHQARYFYFVDEALPPKTVHHLARRVQESGLDIRWFSESRAEKAFSTPAALQALRDSGCSFLVHGIESGNPEVSRRLLKGIDLAATAEHLRNCKAAGIGTAGMFFVGFPGETAEQAEDTFRFIEKNYEYLDFASVGVFHLERGTPVFLTPDVYGIAEILDTERPFPIAFEYRMEGESETTGPVKLRSRLRELHAKFHHMRPKFVKAVDRAMIVFLKEYDQFGAFPLERPQGGVPIDIRYGAHQDRRGTLDIYRHRLTVFQ